MTLKLFYFIIEKMQYLNFGNFIRNKRLKTKMSLNKFAFMCGLEPASLSDFETGKSDILFKNFLKIASGFNQTPAEFLLEFENYSHIV